VEIAEFQAGDFHLPAENEKEPYCYRLGGQLLTRRTLSVLTSDSRISKRAPNDVRWEKVQQIKPNVTGGTYPVPPEQVAAKLIEHMRDRGRAMRRRKRDSSEDPFPHGSTDFQKLSVKENATVEQATLKSLLMVRMAKF
jgi:hypothetical protein